MIPQGNTPKREVREYLIILLRRKWTVVHCFWITTVLVTAGSFLLPPKYEAQGKVLLHRGRVDLPVTSAKTSQVPPKEVTEEDLNSEVEILTSRPLREEVVRRLNLGLDEEEGLLRDLNRWLRSVLVRLSLLEPLTDEQRAILDFEKKLDVSVVRKSNIITVTYSHSKPDRTAAVINTLVDLYMDRHQQLRQVPGNQEFFRQQTEALRKSLERAEAELKEFEAQGSLAALNSQKEAIVTKLADFEASLKNTRADIAETVRKIDSLRDQLRSEPARLPTPNRSFLNLAVEETERKLVALELERNRIRQSYLPESRRLLDLDQEIALAQERLARARQEAGPLDRTEVNPVHQTLQKDLLAAETSLAAFQARQVEQKASVVAFRRQLEELNEKGYRLKSLDRLAKADEDSYLVYMKKLEEARIENAMNQGRMLNVVVAEPALPPLKAKFPNKPLNILIAMAIGLFGGMALALVQQNLDRSVWSERDIEEEVGIPVLADIPETPTLLASFARPDP